MLFLFLLVGIRVLRSPVEPVRSEKSPEAKGLSGTGSSDPILSPNPAPLQTTETILKEETEEENPEDQLAWAKRRRIWMKDLIRRDPERALKEALTMKERAALPAEVAAEVEQVVSGKGFFWVLAVCNHGEGEVGHASDCEIKHEVVLGGKAYRAYVYGKRLEKLTTENDSIYGVAVDGELALHEEIMVRMDPEDLVEPPPEGAVVVVYEGETRIFEDEEELTEWREELKIADLEAASNLGPPEP